MKYSFIFIGILLFLHCSRTSHLKVDEYTVSKTEPIYLPSIRFSRNANTHSLEEEITFEIMEILNKRGYVVFSDVLESESPSNTSVRASVQKAIGHEKLKTQSQLDDCNSYPTNQSPCMEIRFFYKPSILFFEDGEFLRIAIKLKKANKIFVSDLEWNLTQKHQYFESNKLALQLLGGIPL